jgi:hypothetical protein
VHAKIDSVLGLASSCHRTAESLQDQRNKIRANEDDRVRPWRKKREGCPVRLYNTAEREIDWCGDQCRRDCEADALDDEVSARDEGLVRDPALLWVLRNAECSYFFSKMPSPCPWRTRPAYPIASVTQPAIRPPAKAPHTLYLIARYSCMMANTAKTTRKAALAPTFGMYEYQPYCSTLHVAKVHKVRSRVMMCHASGDCEMWLRIDSRRKRQWRCDCR